MKKNNMHNFLFALCFLLIACSNPSDSGSDDASALPPGMGSFSLMVSSSRTVMPDTPALTDLKNLVLIFTATGGGAVSKTETVSYDGNPVVPGVLLASGQYSLTVNAYKGPVTAANLAARGTLDNIVIDEGSATPGAVTLKPLILEGSGTFRWDITVPDNVYSTATMTIAPLATGTTTNVSLTITDKKLSGSRSLSSGYYNITFKFEKRESANTMQELEWSELVHVYSALESVFTKVFTDDDFNSLRYTVTFDFDNSWQQDGKQTVIHGETASAPAPDTTPPAGLYPGTPDARILEDWFIDGIVYDFDNLIIRDITLKAQWDIYPLTEDELDTSGDNYVEKAIQYTIDHPAAYTLFIGEDVIIAPQILNAANLNLIIAGLKAARTISCDSETSPLFTISHGDTTLTVGAYINLLGGVDVISGKLELKGNSTLDSVTLNQWTAPDIENTVVDIASGWTGSVNSLNLCKNNADLDGVADFWLDKTIMRGGSLSTATAERFTLGNFIGSGGVTAPIKESDFSANNAPYGYTIYINIGDDIGILTKPGLLELINLYGRSSFTGDMTITLWRSEILRASVTIPAKANSTLTITSEDPVNITISLGLQQTTSDSGLFILSGNNARLILENIIIDGNKETHTGNTTPLVRVSGGTLTMRSGAVLKNNRASSGGAVYVNSGTFTMAGGTISGNTASSGGGVCVYSGTFNLNSGTISGNTATSSGGGVYNNSTFAMTGGTINGNTASSGGGVYNSSGTFTMSSGFITNNTVSGSSGSGGGVYNSYRFNMSGGVINENTATNGGGVYNYNSEPSTSSNYVFNMSGGKITGNTATNGGGVYNTNNTFVMSGSATIGGSLTAEANTAADNGGGVYNNGIFTIGGASVIRGNKKDASSLNNVYLTGYKFISLGTGTNAPAADMSIYIHTPGTGGIVVQSGAKPGDASYFEADSGQTVEYKDGVLAIDLSLDAPQLDFYMRVAAYAYAAADVAITVGQDLTLPIPVVVPSNASGKTLTIKGSTANRTLTRDFTDTESYSGLFIIQSGAKLTFENVIIDGNTRSANTATLARVNGGAFTMGNGAVLQNNRASSGGGVYINSGTFTMNGGKISENTASSGGGVYVGSGTFAMNSGEISGNTASSGGGVCVGSGTFTMNSGEISGNTATSSGGGVYNSSGTFTMNSGFITDNTATSQGGGVNNSSGTFTMTGGYIIGNTVNGSSGPGGGVYNNYRFTMSGGKISENNATNGGGVYNVNYSGNSTSYYFTMSGGEISRNTAASSGGGVYNYYGIFNMSGGKITGNTAANGGGVYNINSTSGSTTYNYTINLGGTAVIKENVNTSGLSKNNVYLANSRYITLGNAPAPGMDIYINFPSTTGSVIVNSGATAEHAVYFHADDNTKTVEYQATGRLVLANAAADPGGINITFDATDEAPEILGNVSIYRSNNTAVRPRSVKLMITGSFTDPRWHWNNNLLSSANSVTLSVDNTPYGKLIGQKFLTLEVMVNGIPYSRMISFWVEQ